MNVFRKLRKRTKRGLVFTTLGMAGGYFFDPQMGPARRRRAKSWFRQLPAIGRRMAAQTTEGIPRRNAANGGDNTLAAAGRSAA